MLTAITRRVSPCIGQCELTYLTRRPIDIQRARQQQQAYERLLSDLGLHVISLPAEQELPDAVFIEDTAVVTDEVAVITTMGCAARRREVDSISPLLEKYRLVRSINGAGVLEGGDVVQQQVYVYAMGQEPWLKYLTSIQYTDESHPIVEFNKLVAACQIKGIESERLYCQKELFLPAQPVTSRRAAAF